MLAQTEMLVQVHLKQQWQHLLNPVMRTSQASPKASVILAAGMIMAKLFSEQSNGSLRCLKASKASAVP